MQKFIVIISCLFIGVRALSQADSLQEKLPPVDSGYYSSFDGTKIYYETRGKGMPVVLVHGFIVTGESWKRTALYNQLIENGFQVITIDMRGNGKSGKPHNPEAYENDAEAKDIMGPLNSLNVKAYHVIGYSRGSIIVSRLLLMDNRVGKAVIGGMGTGFTDSLWPRRIMFYNALSGKDVPELAAMVKNVQKAGLDQTALAFLQRSQPSTSPAELQKINRPVLLVCGDADEDNGSGKALSAMIPHSTFVTVPGDHNNASHSKEFANTVISFLNK